MAILGQKITPGRKTICLCHDLERGLGHIGTDPIVAERANKDWLSKLEKMLRIEKEMTVKATYNVVGCIFNEVRIRIEREGHCMAFHSYDHNLNVEQLQKCRQIDNHVRGYRPPQSVITTELSDDSLRFYNFEWLASSANSLGINYPKMQNGIVKIPISFDDFDLYRRTVKYEDWERSAIESIKRNRFVAFCLHDCYANYWLSDYERFLGMIVGLGKLKTLDEVAKETRMGLI